MADQQQQQAPPAGQPPVAQEGQQDALDKGLQGAIKKGGYNIDAKTTEKVSDGVRGFFKKITGKDVPIADKQ